MKTEKLTKRKDFKEENISDNNKKEVKMAYYCRVCQCWHYPGSAVYYSHKIYSSKSPKPKKVVKRRKRSFWDRF